MIKKNQMLRLLMSGFFLFVLSGAGADSIVTRKRTQEQREIDEKYSGKENFFYHPSVIARHIRNADLIIKATAVSDLSNVLRYPGSIFDHKEVSLVSG